MCRFLREIDILWWCSVLICQLRASVTVLTNISHLPHESSSSYFLRISNICFTVNNISSDPSLGLTVMLSIEQCLAKHWRYM